MVLPQPLPRASGVFRWAGILVLLAGIAAMHAGVFVTHGHADSHRMESMVNGAISSSHTEISTFHAAISTSHASGPAAHASGPAAHGTISASHATAATELGLREPATAAQLVTHAAPSMSTAPDLPGPHTDCGDGSCLGAHGGLHGCVFILTVLALAIALIALYRLAGDRRLGEVTAVRERRPGRAPPPPWTVPSLSELSILRI